MKRLVIWLWRAYRLRQMQRDLYALSDHQLRDIGLRREQISYLDSLS